MQRGILILFKAGLLLLMFPASVRTNDDAWNDGSSPGTWSISPVIGFISGGYIADSPGSGDLIYGLKISHYRSGTTWIDAGVNRVGRSGSIFFINSKANYHFLKGRSLRPFVSTGAGLITSGSGGVFDFLYGGGLLITIADRLFATQAYIIHHPPSQALSDEEGNPFNSLETSLHVWF